MMSLLFSQISWSTWAQPDTVVVNTSCDGAALESDSLVVVGPTSHCEGRHGM